MQRIGVIILASVALVAVAIIVAAYMFTHKPEPEVPDLLQRVHQEKVACLEGGGTWENPGGSSFGGTCKHPSVESAAPAVGTSSMSAEQIVDTFSAADQAKFCSSANQLGFPLALSTWKSEWDAESPPAEQVFEEAYSRCISSNPFAPPTKP